MLTAAFDAGSIAGGSSGEAGTSGMAGAGNRARTGTDGWGG